MMRHPQPQSVSSSLPGFNAFGARITHRLELAFAGIGLAAASAVLAAGMQADSYDLPHLLKLGCGLLLLIALTGMWLTEQFAGAPRTAVAMIYAEALRRLSPAGPRPEPQEGESSPFGSLAELLRDMATNARARRDAGRRAMDAADAHNRALRAGRDAASCLAGAVGSEVEAIAELTLDMDSVAGRLSGEIGTATRICEVTRDVAGKVADRAADLTGAILASTADADRMAASAIALSEISFETQRQIVGLVGRTEDLADSADQAQRVLDGAGILTLNADMEAARGGAAQAGFTALAAEVKLFAANAAAALAALRVSVAELRHETSLAARCVNEVVETVHVQQGAAQSLCRSVAQQGAEIGGLLQTLRDAQTGFGTLLASVDAVTQDGITRVRKAHSLRGTALRLPDQAEQVVRILRDIPDFEPPLEM